MIMKNSEIHNSLDKKEIRDFLSIGLVQLFEEEKKNKRDCIFFDNGDMLEWGIKDAEAHIEYFKKYIEISKSKQAIIRLIKMNNWQEFDVSDETQKDLSHSLALSFIGTEEEYKNLLKQIKNKKP
jgi:hypothetical protein